MLKKLTLIKGESRLAKKINKMHCIFLQTTLPFCQRNNQLGTRLSAHICFVYRQAAADRLASQCQAPAAPTVQGSMVSQTINKECFLTVSAE